MPREVTENDFRCPEFRDMKPEDYEFRPDGKLVRKDRWETGIRKIVGIIGMSRDEFEINDVVERVWDMEQRLAKYEGRTDAESDGVCTEPDGCPVELAVLKRFWRDHQAKV